MSGDRQPHIKSRVGDPLPANDIAEDFLRQDFGGKNSRLHSLGYSVSALDKGHLISEITKASSEAAMSFLKQTFDELTGESSSGFDVITRQLTSGLSTSVQPEHMGTRGHSDKHHMRELP